MISPVYPQVYPVYTHPIPILYPWYTHHLWGPGSSGFSLDPLGLGPPAAGDAIEIPKYLRIYCVKYKQTCVSFYMMCIYVYIYT